MVAPSCTHNEHAHTWLAESRSMQLPHDGGIRHHHHQDDDDDSYSISVMTTDDEMSDVDRESGEDDVGISIKLRGAPRFRQCNVVVYTKDTTRYGDVMDELHAHHQTLCRNAITDEFWVETAENKPRFLLTCRVNAVIVAFAFADIDYIKPIVPMGYNYEMRQDKKYYLRAPSKTNYKLATTQQLKKAWGGAKPEEAKRYNIRMLYITLVCSHRGYGATMMRSLEALARKEQVLTMALRAATVDLVHYYRRHGFSRELRGCGGVLSDEQIRKHVIMEQTMLEKDHGYFMMKCLSKSSPPLPST